MESASKFQMEQSNFDNRESTSTGTRKVISVKDIMKSRFYAVLQYKKNQVQTEIEDNNDVHDTDIVDDQDIHSVHDENSLNVKRQKQKYRR